VLYLLAIGAAWLNVWVSGGIYIFAALIWLIPDRRIEDVVQEAEGK
jgi:hypothetical protein